MLKNEITINRKLSNHPNFARILEVHETEKSIYIVTELLEGPSLIPIELKITNNSFFKFISREMLTILKYMRDQSIVHRDLKPENIMFKNTNESLKLNTLKIIDFGLAVDLSKKNIDLENLRCGTPGFIAPEIFFMKEEQFFELTTSKIDIFSLGVIFHYFVYGIYPYGKGERDQVLEKNVYDLREKVDELKDQILEERDALVADLIFGMLEKDYERRFDVEDCLNHPFFHDI